MLDLYDEQHEHNAAMETIYSASQLTLLPSLTWKTGPTDFTQLPAALAWQSPILNRLPKTGTLGASGSPLILGILVRVKY